MSVHTHTHTHTHTYTHTHTTTTVTLAAHAHRELTRQEELGNEVRFPKVNEHTQPAEQYL